MNKKIIVGAILGIILVSMLLAIALGPEANRFSGYDKADGMIGVIYVEGTITGERLGEGVFAPVGATSDSLMKQLREARDFEGIDVVLLRINSPGGSAAASQEIGREIDKLKEAGKKVVVSMGDIAASGGYWLAAKADVIVANPTTTTGSIGVIMQTASLKELLDKLGIEFENITSGEFKDIGAMNKSLSEEERELLQAMVNDIFEQFVEVVAEGRNMSKEEVLKVADGRVFTGRQAKELGLVDELGNFYDAIEIAKDLAGIEGEAELYEFGMGGGFLDLLFRVKGGNFSLKPEWILKSNELTGIGGIK